jgi:hypothetical protein
MREYLIRRTDGEWFDLHRMRWPEVLRPNTVASKTVVGPGDYRIEVKGAGISFAYEDPGIHICIEGELPEALSRRVVVEVLANIEQATGQRGRIVEL